MCTQLNKTLVFLILVEVKFLYVHPSVRPFVDHKNKFKRRLGRRGRYATLCSQVKTDENRLQNFVILLK